MKVTYPFLLFTLCLLINTTACQNSPSQENSILFTQNINCQNNPQCEALSVEVQSCGESKNQIRTCNEQCQWGAFGPCEEICQPGETETLSCNNGQGQQTRLCQADGSWGDFSKCMDVCEDVYLASVPETALESGDALVDQGGNLEGYIISCKDEGFNNELAVLNLCLYMRQIGEATSSQWEYFVCKSGRGFSSEQLPQEFVYDIDYKLYDSEVTLASETMVSPQVEEPLEFQGRCTEAATLNLAYLSDYGLDYAAHLNILVTSPSGPPPLPGCQNASHTWPELCLYPTGSIIIHKECL
ncbi:MAG: hypothetical protein KDK66_00150 [Deltaproteobacteria bacterium]|nr:hypothetical protein [Deltaproteobacteria bacterium]